MKSGDHICLKKGATTIILEKSQTAHENTVEEMFLEVTRIGWLSGLTSLLLYLHISLVENVDG